MLKFFRSLRSSKLEQKRFSKYLIYAVGEIILVIIGILIALYINNWNNNNSNIDKQKVLIHQVKLDLEQSVEELKDIISFHETRAFAAAQVSQAFWKKDTVNNALVRSFGIPLSNKRYSPNMSMISSLISSGDIELVQSVTIRSQINAYFENVNTILEDILRYEEQYYRPGVEIVTANFDINSFSLSHLKEEYIENITNFRLASFPKDFKEVPFPIELQDVYKNQQIYNGYGHLLISFRNTKSKYETILIQTRNLLNALKEAEY